MMRVFSASLLAVLCASAMTAGDLESGPQPGKGVTPFHPYNVFNADNPASNGKENCLV